MNKHLLLILLGFVSFGVSAEEEKTIVCIMDGKSDEYVKSSNSRQVKVTQTIKFNESNVTSFKHDFLTDYDFLERELWDYGFKNDKLGFQSSISDDEITISITEKENDYQNRSENLFVNWVRWDLTINRKSGVGKVYGSLAYRIYDTPPFSTSTLTLEEIKASPSNFYNMSYSAFGDCSLSKNKF
tara:strand:- start:2941 stop:3495 length:555 start_codon:yes stop_codon:yes gene_type:complete